MATKCQECGAPEGTEYPCGSRVKVTRQSDQARNHAARGRELCQDCERYFEREADGVGAFTGDYAL